MSTLSRLQARRRSLTLAPTVAPTVALTLALLLTIAAYASTSSAATVFNSFGPGDSYGPTDSDITGPFQLGFQFTVDALGPDYDLSQVVLPLDSVTAPTTTHIFLAIDDGGAPGAVIANFPTIDVLNPLPGDIFSVAPLAPASLLAGQSYWLVNTPPPGVEIGWGNNAAGSYLTGAYRSGDTGSWTSFSSNVAFRIEATPIPEPSMALLFGLGLVGLSRTGARVQERAFGRARARARSACRRS